MLHCLLSVDPAGKPSFCHGLTSFSSQASKRPESIVLQEPLCNHTLQSNSSLMLWPQSSWWQWSTAVLSHPVLSHQPSLLSAGLSAPGAGAASKAFQSFLSSLLIYQLWLSPTWEEKALESWKVLYFTCCHRWESSCLVANEHQEYDVSFQPVTVTLFEMLQWFFLSALQIIFRAPYTLKMAIENNFAVLVTG